MSSIPDLTAHLGYLLRMVSNAVSQEFARKVAREGVTVAEWVMLRALFGRDAITPTALAGEMGMTKGAISKLAERLLDKGLIERTDNATDKRGHSLSLSPRGADKVPILAALADTNDAAFFAVLSGDQRDHLQGVLRDIIGKHGLTVVPVD